MNLEAAIVLATLITNIAGFAYTWFRESRQHRWAMEDREKATNKITTQVGISANAAGDAYKEANSVNLKIQKLAEELTELRRQLDKRSKKK